MSLLNDIFDCLRSGSIYALISLSLALIYVFYGTISFINGEVITYGIYVFAFFYSGGSPLICAFVLTCISCCGISFLTCIFVYKPLRKRPRHYALAASIGTSFLFRNFMLLLFSPNAIKIKSTISGYTKIFFASIENTVLAAFLFFLIIALGVYCFFKYTKIGRLISAVSDNPESAMDFTMNMFSLSFMLNLVIGVLLAAAGFLFSSSFPVVDPYVGTAIGMRALVGAIIGGLGLINTIPACIPHVLLGGFSVGIIETLVKSYISVQASDFVIYLILILYLIINYKKYKHKTGGELL